jgi:DnaK suppressor protein
MRTSIGSQVLWELQQVLEHERAHLHESLRLLAVVERSLGEAQHDEGAAGGDPADLASNAVEYGLDRAFGQVERARLEEVEAALQRLAAGTFGACECCDRPIELPRLLAVPWAPHCLSCATRRLLNRPPRGGRDRPSRSGL